MLLVLALAAMADLDDAAPHDTLCSNNCSWASDGQCDDAGPHSHFSLCPLGTDCADCGPRTVQLPPPPASPAPPVTPTSPRSPPASPPPANPPGICDDSCRYANDGECDDGGDDAHFWLCPHGSDCTDCGARSFPPPQSPPMPPSPPLTPGGLCSNDCAFARDGHCDDGGPHSHFSLCPLGSDCADCGVRATEDLLATPPSSPSTIVVDDRVSTNRVGQAGGEDPAGSMAQVLLCAVALGAAGALAFGVCWLAWKRRSAATGPQSKMATSTAVVVERQPPPPSSATSGLIVGFPSSSRPLNQGALARARQALTSPTDVLKRAEAKKMSERRPALDASARSVRMDPMSMRDVAAEAHPALDDFDAHERV